MAKETNVSENPIRYVPQNHTTQKDKCGVACIAMICGKSFEDADAKWRSNRNHTGLAEMTAWLTEFGATHDGEWIRPSADFDLKALNHDAVLLTELDPGDWVANGHWAVWDADTQRILDPWSRSSRLGSADVDRYLLIKDRP